MLKRILVAVLLLAVNGCTWNFWHKDFTTDSNKLQPPKLELLSLSMTKQEVTSIIGKPYQVVGAKKNGNSFIETWEYIRVAAVPGPDQIAERYQVEFTDGKLSSYSSSGDFKQQINIKK